MKRKNWLLLAVFVLLSSLLVACGTAGDEGADNQGAEDNALNFINGDTIPSMDPSLATDEYGFQFLGATMEGLYRLGENAEPVEGIATNHEISEDGLTYTFHLREDAVWSNGDPVTAHDFVYAWRRAVDPNTGSEYGPYMMSGVIKNAEAINKGEVPVEELGVTAQDDYTLVVELENPTPYFLSLTTFGTFLPLNQKFVEEQGDAFATSSDTLLANGPFTLVDWSSTGQKWSLEKNDQYWDADTVKIEKMNFVVIKDPQTSIELYEKGEVDRVTLTSDNVDVYSTHDDYVVYPQTSISYIKMNQERDGKETPLANKNIRNAIARAFDKEAIVDNILNNGSIAANGLIPKDFVNIPGTEKDFREVNGDLITFDVEAAQEYWEKGLAELGIDSIEIEILADDSEGAKNMTESIANQLSTNLPGLSVSIRNIPFQQRLNADGNQDYDIQIAVWGPDYLDPKTFLDMWVSGSGNNKMSYSNPEYDALIEAASTTNATDNKARYENFLEAEKILMDDAAIAPIYQRATAQLVSPRVEGVFVNPFGATYEYKWGSIGSAE